VSGVIILLYNNFMVYLGADHRGWQLKEGVKEHLAQRNIAFVDLGDKQLSADDDFVDYALAVAQAVAADPEEHLGILMCGSGAGVDTVANKVKGVRSSILFDPDQALRARQDDAINVLSLPADYLTPAKALNIVDEWLDAAVSSVDRYQRRRQKILAWEDRVFK
jgi:RpiB/LacA/LacB family sugar-phosphate isomerase